MIPARVASDYGTTPAHTDIFVVNTVNRRPRTRSSQACRNLLTSSVSSRSLTITKPFSPYSLTRRRLGCKRDYKFTSSIPWLGRVAEDVARGGNLNLFFAEPNKTSTFNRGETLLLNLGQRPVGVQRGLRIGESPCDTCRSWWPDRVTWEFPDIGRSTIEPVHDKGVT